jgi:hypothetical protein
MSKPLWVLTILCFVQACPRYDGTLFYTQWKNLILFACDLLITLVERQTLGFVVADLAASIVKVEKGLAESIFVGNLNSIREFFRRQRHCRSLHFTDGERSKR